MIAKPYRKFEAISIMIRSCGCVLERAFHGINTADFLSKYMYLGLLRIWYLGSLYGNGLTTPLSCSLITVSDPGEAQSCWKKGCLHIKTETCDG